MAEHNQYRYITQLLDEHCTFPMLQQVKLPDWSIYSTAKYIQSIANKNNINFELPVRPFFSKNTLVPIDTLKLVFKKSNELQSIVNLQHSASFKSINSFPRNAVLESIKSTTHILDESILNTSGAMQSMVNLQYSTVLKSINHYAMPKSIKLVTHMLDESILNKSSAMQSIVNLQYSTVLKSINQKYNDALKKTYTNIKNISKLFKEAVSSINPFDIDILNPSLKNIFLRLLEMDWYIPIWSIPIDVLSNHTYESLDTIGLDELKAEDKNDILIKIDEFLFNDFQHYFTTREKFMELISDEGLYINYQNRYYKNVVTLCLVNIESILTSFVNRLNGNALPPLHDYLTLSDRSQFLTFEKGKVEKYINDYSLEKIQGDGINRTSISVLKLLFKDKQTFLGRSQLYRSFDKDKSNPKCNLTITDDIPLCRNLFLHGLGSEKDISQKLAIKALIAYRFFKEFIL